MRELRFRHPNAHCCLGRLPQSWLSPRSGSPCGAPNPPRPRTARLTAFGVLAPEKTFFPRAQTPPIELSADGRTLLFATESEQGASIYRRSFDRMEVTRVDGTDGGKNPVLSPDGRTIAFFADGRLQKIPIEGGKPIDLAEARAPRGGSWATDGSLIFSPVFNSGLWRVAATGGAPVEVTQLDTSKGERTHRWPQVLPGGRRVIFTVGLLTNPSDYDDATIEALDFDTGERRTILEGARMARYTAAGYLVFQRRETLLAIRFDPIRLERSGKPFVIQEGVGGATRPAGVSASLRSPLPEPWPTCPRVRSKAREFW